MCMPPETQWFQAPHNKTYKIIIKIIFFLVSLSDCQPVMAQSPTKRKTP